MSDYSQIKEYISSQVLKTKTSELKPKVAVYDCGGGYTKTFNISQDLQNKMGISDLQLKGGCPKEYNGVSVTFQSEKDFKEVIPEINKILDLGITENHVSTWEYTDTSEIIIIVGK
jgi:hypothetical protein